MRPFLFLGHNKLIEKTWGTNMNDSTTTASLSGRLFKASCVAAIAYVMTRPGDTAPTEVATAPDLEWALVIDMGCEPQDLQRVLKKAQENPKVLRPVAADSGDGEPCWRLVWGRFTSQAKAEAAVQEIPSKLRRQGFDPHPIELTGEELDSPIASGG